MRIVIDLQGAQSTGSRHRGIGRYTMALALAIVRNRGDHEVLIALNGLFPETIPEIRVAFQDLLPAKNIRVWRGAGLVAASNPAARARREAAQLLMEGFLASLEPDVIFVSSHFEGWVDDATTSIGHLKTGVPTVVTLYDLIPHLHAEIYLADPVLRVWYQEKLADLGHADLLLAISESSRQEAITCLNLPPERAVNISSDVDPQFKPESLDDSAKNDLKAKFGLSRPFVMYTGGIDHRKNIDRLIGAFAALPEAYRDAHQLVIVCSATKEVIATLQEEGRLRGLSTEHLVFTGFVSDQDLVRLYNLCHLFIFPSWHEGFGLPALEAMRCGAPVIGSNCTSIPEVIGWSEAMFDPHSEVAMRDALLRGLEDEAFRLALKENSRRQSVKFSWDISAQNALKAMERLIGNENSKVESDPKSAKPRLAYLSPLPPERSGIAYYSRSLIQVLGAHYEITCIVDQPEVDSEQLPGAVEIQSAAWFRANADRFDRVLYHFGNSAFHQFMLPLVAAYPGVVVQHDFFLSGVLWHMSVLEEEPEQFVRALFESHGYAAVRDYLKSNSPVETLYRFPMSFEVLRHALGLIAHSPYSLELSSQWFGISESSWEVIPHLMAPPSKRARSAARKGLDLPEDAFLVATFGMLGPTKQNQRLFSAWIQSKLHADPKAYLVFVGENDQGDYGKDLAKKISKARGRIRITGWADDSLYQQYLAAADVAVQLRTLSRGETSGAVCDCLNLGIPTIVNAHGSLRDLQEDLVLKVPDEFSDRDLVGALETLFKNRSKREALGQKAAAWMESHHRPKAVAKRYKDAIEKFYAQGRAWLPRVMKGLVDQDVVLQASPDLEAVASALDFNFPEVASRPRVFLDFSPLSESKQTDESLRGIFEALTVGWTETVQQAFRLEAVYSDASGVYHRAASKVFEMLGQPNPGVLEEIVLPRRGDLILDFVHAPSIQPPPEPMLMLTNSGAQRLCVPEADWCVGSQRERRAFIRELQTRVLEIILQ